jgi:competence protein ComEA
MMPSSWKKNLKPFMFLTGRQVDGMLAVVVITAVVCLISFFSHRHASKDDGMVHGDPRDGPVVVKLSGALRQGGIYYLPGQTQLSGLLEIAGIEDRNPSERNLRALPLSTGLTVTLDAGHRQTLGQMDAAMRLALDLPIDLNRATLDDLMLIPGIGESTAAKIVQYREGAGPFRNVADLKNIPGIKEKKLAQWGRHFYLPR